MSNKNQPTKAAEALEEYADTAPAPEKKAYAEVLSGSMYEREGGLDKARAVYERAKDQPAADGGLAANEGLARVETKAGNKDKAIAYWRTCIELKSQVQGYKLVDQDIATYKGYISALGGKP